MRTEREDIPKIVASVMVSVPRLGIRTGLIYLKTKRRLRKNAQRIMKGMVDGGMPEDFARRLAADYEADLSIRNLTKNLGRPFWSKDE